MQPLRIKILDSIHCRALDKYTMDFIQPLLSYEEITTRVGPRGPISKVKRVSLLSNKGLFNTGLWDRIFRYALSKGITIEGTVPNEGHQPPAIQILPNLTYKPFQEVAIKKGLFLRRGVIHAPARSGKTVIIMGSIKSNQYSNPNFKALVVVNTKDIFHQTKEEFYKYGFKFGLMGDGIKDHGKNITIGLYQTLNKHTESILNKNYDAIYIDECHHARKKDGSYWNILTNSLAPIKLGFTATPPDNSGEFLVMEALLGPIIHEVSQEESKEMGSTVGARIRIVKCPENLINIKRMSYIEAYEAGIIQNRALNRLIANIADEYIQSGNTVLILVARVAHGFHLEKIFTLLYPNYNVPFICGGLDADTRKEIESLKEKLKHGSNPQLDKKLEELREVERKVKSKSENRNEFRHALISRQIPCVITTTVWNEGVNIPTLNVLINAAGGKSEIRTIQSASRSLTACVGKEEGIIVDLFNPLHRSFIEHFGHRVSTYCDMGWM